MKRKSVIVSDEADEIIKAYQKKTNIGTQDEAIDAIIRDWGKSHPE